MATTGIRAYFETPLAREIERIARVQGRSESSVIVDAVRAHLAAGSEAALKAADETQKRQLNRMEARIDTLVGELVRLRRAFTLFVRLWLEHNPPIQEEFAESAASSALARLEHFLDLVAHGAGDTGTKDRGLPAPTGRSRHLTHEDAE
jgi:hypothetical protein